MSEPKLQPFQGHEVVQLGMRLTNTGDGLSEAMAIAGTPHKIGDRVAVLTIGTLQQVWHRPLAKDSTDLLRLIETVKVDEGTEIPLDVADDLIATTRKVIADAKEEARLAEEEEAGIMRLPDGSEASEQDLINARDDADATDELEKARGRRAAGRGKKKAGE